MRRTTIVLGIAMVGAGAGVIAGCSPAGADAAASQDASYRVATPCEFADADSLLYLVAGGDVTDQIAQPFVFDRVDCSGTTATAYTMPDGVTGQVAARFEYSVGCWRPITVGPATPPTTRPTTTKSVGTTEEKK
ncbi:hypothetical protein L5G32_17645 [Gordonia sp. HY002]|uniref:hypothetical protein n=1 Tax=Gordonia zhenghanii TaxID=2911516 RepID=UPI001EEF7FF4|nr:hypothetical protein [Gordonia zhenghanii]MCF8572095.1 hypothetical protein [Gordonia zhenghanii]MCF8602969.1 hypothetical protein [Gordonia zhenghanii]